MNERGFSLVETMIATGILATGLLGALALLAANLQRIASSPRDLLATHKAAEAIESVFSARDSHALTWVQIRNVNAGGIFLDGPQPIRASGPDGLGATADDGDVETVVHPGPDQQFGTGDDVTVSPEGFTREVQIRDVQESLREITVIVTYPEGAGRRTYTLTAYISRFA